MSADNVYGRAIADVTHRRMHDPNWSSVLSETLVKLNDGFWEKKYVDFFFQKGGWMNQRYTLEDAYAFVQMHCDFCSGNIVSCDLNIGETPSPDNQIEINLQKLKNGIRDLVCVSESAATPVFDVDVWCGTELTDGMLSWSPYLVFDRFLNGQHNGTLWMTEGRASLEIGSQAAEKSLIQLRSGGALARWPYGSNSIRIFVMTDKHKYHRSVPYPVGKVT